MANSVIIKFCEDDDQITAAYPIMAQLRPHLDEAEFFAQIRRLMQSGYRMVSANIGDEVVGVMGYRFLEDLARGRTLYVDDLVVNESNRDQGIGESLMKVAEMEAERRDCETLRLCSGLQREPAHRFYEGIGMEKSSYAFVKKLI
tara:strand:- start:4639 stop:5073 length:435 start_codon:yes stop_codon:yes gene_type:complete